MRSDCTDIFSPNCGFLWSNAELNLNQNFYGYDDNGLVLLRGRNPQNQIVPPLTTAQIALAMNTAPMTATFNNSGTALVGHNDITSNIQSQFSIMDLIKENPIPAILITLGIGYLFTR